MWNRTSESARALRVGLIYDGVVVEERIVESPRPVTLGTAPGATLSLDAPDVPSQMQLFDWESGEYVLRADRGMSALVRSDGEVRRLDEIRLFTETDDRGVSLVSIADISEGRIQIGDAVVLFQRVSPTDDPDPPSLPGELRRGLFAGMDGRLAVVLAATAALQLGFVAWTQFTDWPRPNRTLERSVPSEFVEIRPDSKMFDESPERESPDPTPRIPSRSGEESEQQPERADADPPENSGDSETSEPTPQRNVGESVRQGTVLEALGARNGADLAGGMETASPVDEFDEALAETNRRGSTEEDALGTGGRSDSEQDGRTLSGGPLGETPGARRAEEGVGTGERSGPTIRCRDCLEPGGAGPTDDGSETRDLGTHLRRHMGRIRACYERALKRDPELSGKLVIAFRVTPGGEARPVVAATDRVGGGVAACVRNVIEGIEFPEGPNRSPRVEKTFLFQPGG